MTSAILPTNRSGSAMNVRQWRRLYLGETRYALVRLWRNPGLSIPSLLFPMAFYLLAGYVFGAFATDNANAPTYLLGGFATMGAMSPGMFVLGIVFASEREQGLYQLRRAMPAPPSALLFGNLAMAGVVTLAAVLTLIAAAAGLGVVALSAPDMLAIAGISALGAIPFCAMGLLLGATLSAKAAPGIVNVVYLLMLYLSGLFIPLPEAISGVVLVSPAFYLHQLMLESIGADNFLVGGAATHVVVLVAVTVLCFGLAMRRLERAG